MLFIINLLLGVFFGVLLTTIIDSTIKKRIQGLRKINFLREVSFVFNKFYGLWNTSITFPQTRLGQFFPFIIFLRMLLSIFVWFFLPLASFTPFINKKLGVVYIIFIFLLQSTIDILSCVISGSKFALISINRKVIQAFSSQFLFINALLAQAIFSSSLDILIIEKSSTITLFYLPLFITVFIALLCKTSLSPFNFDVAINEILGGVEAECSGRLAVYKRLTFSLDVLFSCALLVTLFFNHSNNSAACSSVALPMLFFILKVFAIQILFFWIHYSLPSYTAYQWHNLFYKIFVPLSLAMLLVSAYMKFSMNH